MLRIPVEVRAEGKCEKYAFSIPAYTCKEDLKQVVEDGMLIHNRNFVQSVELVCSQMLCTILVSLSSHFFTLRCSFVGCYGYPEHDLPTSRVLTQLRDAERLRLYAQLVVSDHRAPWTKISVFSADISPKYRFSVSLEKKNAQKFRLFDFSRKFPIFPDNFR